MHKASDSVCHPPTFNRLFTAHAKTIRNYVFYKCGDADQAEDIMQESYIKLWDNCKKVVYEKARAFLYKVATNIFYNQAARQEVRLEYASLPHSGKNVESPDFLLEEKEFMEKLQKAIGELSEGQREVFLLNRIDKKTYREIAEMLDISVKAVEKRMHQALKELRKLTKNI